jgi:hypothetical protein
MGEAVTSASRRALATVVLLGTGWLVVWLAAFRIGHFGYPGDATKPEPQPASASARR